MHSILQTFQSFTFYYNIEYEYETTNRENEANGWHDIVFSIIKYIHFVCIQHICWCLMKKNLILNARVSQWIFYYDTMFVCYNNEQSMFYYYISEVRILNIWKGFKTEDIHSIVIKYLWSFVLLYIVRYIVEIYK